ncbi:hypothetical protein ACRALDRAFT_213480 [Sodiomyces alcalophilus JCM 7366]|uniref:uncharacterized protein n=1 Tax=Sodiomyces alcalophilus JCM 7366 TaxID=591952 RepID=UPI0039B45AAA
MDHTDRMIFKFPSMPMLTLTMRLGIFIQEIYYIVCCAGSLSATFEATARRFRYGEIRKYRTLLQTAYNSIAAKILPLFLRQTPVSVSFHRISDPGYHICRAQGNCIGPLLLKPEAGKRRYMSKGTSSGSYLGLGG